MAIAIKPSGHAIEIINRDIDSALNLALKDPLANAGIIAGLTQLKQDCTIAVKTINSNTQAVSIFYKDLPYNSISLLIEDDNDAYQLIEGLSRKHPRLMSEPIFGLYTSDITEIIERCFRVIQKTPEVKMVLSDNIIPEVQPKSSEYRLERITTQDLVEISNLYRMVPAMHWTPKLLTFGPYYGVYLNQYLVSLAGVQFATKWVTEIGNIVTHFKHRNQNLAYCCTRTVAEKLRSVSENIFLCVLKDNTPAIRLYQKMGFETVDDIYLVQYYLK